MHQSIIRGLGCALLISLAACGGGGGAGSSALPSAPTGSTTTPPTTGGVTASPAATTTPATTSTPATTPGPGSTPTPAPGTLAISIAVPGRAGTMARPMRVHPATPAQNVQAVVVIQPQNGSAVTPAPIACTSTCTTSVQVPAGVAQINVTLQDATSKAALGMGAASIVVASGKTASLPVALDGVVNSVGVALSQTSLNAGSPGQTTAVVNAYDAQGNLITYGGTYLDASGNPVVIGLASSDATDTLSTTDVTAPNTIVTVNYSGAASQGIASIVPSIVSGSAAGTMTAAQLSIVPTITPAPLTWPFSVYGATADSAYLTYLPGGGGLGFASLHGTGGGFTASSSWTPTTMPWRTSLSSDGYYNVPGTNFGNGYVANQTGAVTPECGAGTAAFADTHLGIVFCQNPPVYTNTLSISGVGTSTFNAAGDVFELGGIPYVNQRGALTPYNGSPPTTGVISTGTMSTCGDGYYYMVSNGGNYGLSYSALQVTSSGPTGAGIALGTTGPMISGANTVPPPSALLTTAKVGSSCSLVSIVNGTIIRATTNGLVTSQTLPNPPEVLFTNSGQVYGVDASHNQYQINI